MTTAAETQERSHTLWTLAGVSAGGEALVLSDIIAGRSGLGKKPTDILHIAIHDRSLDMLAEALAFFAPDTEILRFPAWDCMPYDRTSPLPAIMAARMRTLAMLAATTSGKPRIILTTANAAVQKLPPRSVMRDIVFAIDKSKPLNVDSLMRYLAAQGYHRSGKAMEPGEFAVRGGIIDIMPAGLMLGDMNQGVRIDLFGDDIESMRDYDPLSQISHAKRDQLLLYPMSEVQLNDTTVERFRERYRELFGAVSKEDPLYESISNKRNYTGMEHWLPLFYDHLDSIFDYCPGCLVTLDSEAESAVHERFESIADYYEARVNAVKNSSSKNSFASGSIYHPVPPNQAFLTEKPFEATLATHNSAVFSPFTEIPDAASVIQLGFRPAIRFAQNQIDRTPFDQLRDHVDSAANNGKSTILACYSQGSRERLQTILLERGFHVITIESWKNTKDVKGKTIGLALLPLENGFETEKNLILSEQDVLGERISRAKPKKKKSDVFLAESADFDVDELIVHKEHGIGRFEGLITLTVSGAAHDCLKIIYANDDKLFLPVENIDMVSRFGLEEEGTQLDKLGGASWQARKAKLKQRIKIAAEALLKTAAERLIRQGTVMETPIGTYDDFVARFPYVETEDQARAIQEVTEDLYSGKPMDRLICGDVGFGKTEVALRAAFVAACNPEHPRQVAVIAPTTLLARQHYRNFRNRFEGFPVTIRQLSRMVTTKEQKETREMLAEGKVDIVVGTHALLSKQVSFKNLGLIIIDEEQHFGVVQKEKLKEMRSEVHVLTLSATPIPRTLQMALTGVRDLSLITTPPVDRLAIRSFVMPFDPVVLREAVLREMHRSGKVFLVTPRIKDIGDLKAQITDLVPEARMAVAHGQMTPASLDNVMNEFYDGQYDILLSTAIIESGLDIPTANTMIIHNSHLFGLSQLYQMRGRVGRGKIRAYAYFLLPFRRTLSRNATRRLEVMQTLDTLGAGFSLASHDMDIRGFGNLVGEEQSGHIREVGVELYQQMLEDAVAALRKQTKNAKVEEMETTDWSPQINLGISVMIPETYVGDLSLRLGLYRRIADMNQETDIDSFAAELVDRFGEMPEEVRHLIATLSIKLLCRAASIERIDVGPKGAVISFHRNTFSHPEKLLEFVERHAQDLKVRPDQKLVFTHDWKDVANKISVIKKLLEQIGALNA